LATGERAQKQDTILKTGQWELDLTLLFMARGGSRMTISKL
jgi:hypothetical protein